MAQGKHFLVILAAMIAFSGLTAAARKRKGYRAAANPLQSSVTTAKNRKTTATSLYVQPAANNPKASPLPKAIKLKHAVVVNAIGAEELKEVFEKGVLTCYQEMQLPSYSRYEKWTQSCYMEVDEKWTPRPTINFPLFQSFKDIQEKCRLIFAQWYAELYSLESVEVTTLNSFVTKYVPQIGKNEFGKHIDGVKVEGSLVLCLPTDEPHDWPGMLVWDGPKERGPVGRDPRPEHLYVMQPGDALLLDRMVWHHGLPITKGHRYVVVNFYAVHWKKVANAAGL